MTAPDLQKLSHEALVKLVLELAKENENERLRNHLEEQPAMPRQPIVERLLLKCVRP